MGNGTAGDGFAIRLDIELSGLQPRELILLQGRMSDTTFRELLQPCFHSDSFRATGFMLVARW